MCSSGNGNRGRVESLLGQPQQHGGVLADGVQHHRALELGRHFPQDVDAFGFEHRRAALLKENYEHYGILFFELLHMYSPIPGHYFRYVEKNAVVDNLEVFKRLDARGKGTIVVTGHFANWEMMGIAGIRGVNVLVTGKTVKPPWLNRKVVASRKSINVRTASGKRILPEIIRWVKQGNTSVFIMDQYAPPPTGVPVEFFGVKVDTQAGVGLVANRTGAPIFTVFQRRDDKGIIHDVFEEVVLTEAELNDPVLATQALSSQGGRVAA